MKYGGRRVAGAGPLMPVRPRTEHRSDALRTASGARSLARCIPRTPRCVAFERRATQYGPDFRRRGIVEVLME